MNKQNFQKAVDLLYKYDVVSKGAELEDPVEKQTLIDNIFYDLIEDRSVDFGDMTESVGIWESGAYGDEYSCLLEEFERASKGRIKVENIVTNSPSEDEEDDIQQTEIKIAFQHNGKKYKWIFTPYLDEIFYFNICRWAEKALSGDVMFMGGDSFQAYCLPKELISELQVLGLETTTPEEYFGRPGFKRPLDYLIRLIGKILPNRDVE